MTKVSNLVDSELVRKLYWEKHLTIRQIAHRLLLSRRLVREVLSSFGALRPPRKNRVFWRGRFPSDAREQAYMMGLRAGDVNVFRQSSRTLVARVSTTHQAMLELFQQTFAPYGQCVLDPRKVFLTGYDWQIRINADNSFEVLIDEPKRIPLDRNLLYEFVAGVSDTDGSWCLFEDKGKTACAFMISSGNKQLLVELKKALEKECFHAYLYRDRRKGTTKVMHGVEQTKEIKLTRDVWRLDIHRREEVRTLARRLLPFSRHQEKIRKMCLILDEENEAWEAMAPKVEELRANIKAQTAKTIRRAEIEYKARHPLADKGGRRLDR